MKFLLLGLSLVSFVPQANAEEWDSLTDYLGNMRKARIKLRTESDETNCASRMNGAKYAYINQRLESYVGQEQNQSCSKPDDCIYFEYFAFISRKDKAQDISTCMIRMGQNALDNCYHETSYFYPLPDKPVPHSVTCIKNRCQAIYTGPESNWNKLWQSYEKKAPRRSSYPDPDQACKTLLVNPLAGFTGH